MPQKRPIFLIMLLYIIQSCQPVFAQTFNLDERRLNIDRIDYSLKFTGFTSIPGAFVGDAKTVSYSATELEFGFMPFEDSRFRPNLILGLSNFQYTMYHTRNSNGTAEFTYPNIGIDPQYFLLKGRFQVYILCPFQVHFLGLTDNLQDFSDDSGNNAKIGFSVTPQLGLNIFITNHIGFTVNLGYVFGDFKHPCISEDADFSDLYHGVGLSFDLPNIIR